MKFNLTGTNFFSICFLNDLPKKFKKASSYLFSEETATEVKLSKLKTRLTNFPELAPAFVASELPPASVESLTLDAQAERRAHGRSYSGFYPQQPSLSIFYLTLQLGYY